MFEGGWSWSWIEQNDFLFPGITIHCPGSPGHGSRFVENTAAEKLVSVNVLGPVKLLNY